MNHLRARAAVIGMLIGLASGGVAIAQTGDGLCDTRQSTAETCVIVDAVTVPDGSALTFTAPNVALRGSITVTAGGTCSLAPGGPCTTDADCAAPARCDRPLRVTLQVTGMLTVDARSQIVARGQAAAGDRIGPAGGTIDIEATDVTVVGTLDASAAGTTGVAAGRGGAILVHGTGNVTVTESGRLDASTARGGCGGSIEIAGSATVVAAGLLSVDGATRGGTVEIGARGYVSAAGTFQASNTNGDLATRPACPDGRGGGRVTVQGGLVEFTGSAKAKGKEAGGGVVRLEGERGLVVDSSAGTTPISVLGGDADAFTAGGGVFLVATGGDVTVRHGVIETDGLGSGLGSDAGAFSISAAAATRCTTSQTPCMGVDDCDPGEACVETGGNVVVSAPVSAVGGAGLGSGCIACEIRATGSVTVTSAIDVSGGKHGIGGKVAMSAGTDLTIGPGAVSAGGGDGGDIILEAGARAGSVRDVSGVLRLTNGADLWAVAFSPTGFGGHIGVEGCSVEIESGSAVRADGVLVGGSVEAVAHDRLAVASLATVSALPNGVITLSYGVDAMIPIDASIEPQADVVHDTTLPPCPACGNGIVEPLEDCDGDGTCPVTGDVCQPPGSAGECTCHTTCGAVPGIQPGEECDGADLGGATCTSLGFPGGTLACDPSCRLDTSGCSAEVCGDGSVGAGEQCDPGGVGGASASFGGATCETLGYPGGGALACTADCGAIVTRPHCAGDVAVPCLTDDDCTAGRCVAGCIECGNGFLDAGEECDEGVSNGSAANHCRLDCRLPRCGDETVDFQHCSADVDAMCASATDCEEKGACVPGEGCDRGVALCIGGGNDGRPCCRASDCPDGECAGGDCSRNRDDVPGCCRCDCTLSHAECTDCDDHDPCTTDACDPVAGCTHVAVEDGTPCNDATVCNGSESCAGGSCRPGTPLDCDDANPCTADACDPASGCSHTAVADGTPCADANPCNGTETCVTGSCRPGTPPTCDDADPCTRDSCGPDGTCRHLAIDLAELGSAVEDSLIVSACGQDPVPPAIIRQLRKARDLVAEAKRAGSPRAGRLIRRAAGKLATALGSARRAAKRRLSAACGEQLIALVDDAGHRAHCLLHDRSSS